MPLSRLFVTRPGGFEPPSFGLEVHPRRLQRTAADGICLQVAAFGTATDCRELHLAETGRYAHRTHTVRPRRRTGSAARRPSRCARNDLALVAVTIMATT